MIKFNFILNLTQNCSYSSSTYLEFKKFSISDIKCLSLIDKIILELVSVFDTEFCSNVHLKQKWNLVRSLGQINYCPHFRFSPKKVCQYVNKFLDEKVGEQNTHCNKITIFVQKFSFDEMNSNIEFKIFQDERTLREYIFLTKSCVLPQCVAVYRQNTCRRNVLLLAL